MSSNSESPIVSYDDAVRFLTEVTPGGKCPMCGTNTWAIAIRADDHTLCYFQHSGFDRGGESAYSLSIDCNTCGYVRVHRAQKIITWLDGNRTKEEPGQ